MKKSLRMRKSQVSYQISVLACINTKKKADFEEAFDAMRLKVSKSSWLDSI